MYLLIIMHPLNLQLKFQIEVNFPIQLYYEQFKLYIFTDYGPNINPTVKY